MSFFLSLQLLIWYKGEVQHSHAKEVEKNSVDFYVIL